MYSGITSHTGFGLTSPGDCWYSAGVREPGGGSMDNFLQSTR